MESNKKMKWVDPKLIQLRKCVECHKTIIEEGDLYLMFGGAIAYCKKCFLKGV